MKRREGDKAGGIDIEDLMVKCKQKVVVGGLKGQKLTSGHLMLELMWCRYAAITG